MNANYLKMENVVGMIAGNCFLLQIDRKKTMKVWHDNINPVK